MSSEETESKPNIAIIIFAIFIIVSLIGLFVYLFFFYKKCPSNCSEKGICKDGKCVCNSGFKGDDCSTINPSTCPNDCSGHGECDNSTATCKCDDGYEGDDCSDLDKTCPNDCSGHGECDNGRCICEPNYSGDDCSNILFKCENDCSGHGKCVNGVCECDEEHTGSDCSESAPKACPNDCSGNGRCNIVTGICECNSGFAPPNCEVTCRARKYNEICSFSTDHYTDKDGKRQYCPYGYNPNFPDECRKTNPENCCEFPTVCRRNSRGSISGTCDYERSQYDSNDL